MPVTTSERLATDGNASQREQSPTPDDAVTSALVRTLDAMTAALASATTTEERIAVVRELGKVTAELEARRVALRR